MEAAPMNIVHLTAEYWPFAQAGGLAEAVRGLAEAQAAVGLQVTVILPLYRSVWETGLEIVPTGSAFHTVAGDSPREIRLFRLVEEPGAPRILFIGHDRLFDRQGIYGEAGVDYPDNPTRFALLSRAAIDVLPQLGSGPTVLHVHDWHAALAATLLATARSPSSDLSRVATVLTVHNAAFQGQFSHDVADQLGLGHDDTLQWNGGINLLKAGLLLADMTTTVSPTHETELRTEQGAFGLHDVFSSLGDRLVGILNGINLVRWDPETDPHLAAQFGRDDLSGKKRCKAALQQHYGLPLEPETPLIAMAGRLVAQKGIDLVLGAEHALVRDAQVIVLGRGGDYYESSLQRMAAAAPQRIAVPLHFSVEREHQLLAGADMLLMPSMYEPCGLTQMRAMRYGTLPVARRVGGLGDTVTDGVNGFLFDDYTTESLVQGLKRAVAAYREPEQWPPMVHAAMATGPTFGWGNSLGKYTDVYYEALRRRSIPVATHRPRGEHATRNATGRAVRARRASSPPR